MTGLKTCRFAVSDKPAKPCASGSLDKVAGIIQMMTYLQICSVCRKVAFFSWKISLRESCDFLGNRGAFSLTLVISEQGLTFLNSFDRCFLSLL